MSARPASISIRHRSNQDSPLQRHPHEIHRLPRRGVLLVRRTQRQSGRPGLELGIKLLRIRPIEDLAVDHNVNKSHIDPFNLRALNMANLPYVTATGNVTRALKGIAAAATPDFVSGNFVKTILKISGGSGDQITSFLKKIGFASLDGSPTDIYRKFRNEATRGRAAASSIRFGYAPLYKRNEYLHELPDKDILGLIVEETGQAADSSVPKLVLASIKAIRGFADFDANPVTEDNAPVVSDRGPIPEGATAVGTERWAALQGGVGLTVGYNIHLNLPPTSDIAVFNAIFKSLKENLLKNDDG